MPSVWFSQVNRGRKQQVEKVRPSVAQPMTMPFFLGNQAAMTVCMAIPLWVASVIAMTSTHTAYCHIWVTLPIKKAATVKQSMDIIMILRAPVFWMMEPTRNATTRVTHPATVEKVIMTAVLQPSCSAAMAGTVMFRKSVTMPVPSMYRKKLPRTIDHPRGPNPVLLFFVAMKQYLLFSHDLSICCGFFPFDSRRCPGSIGCEGFPTLLPI